MSNEELCERLIAYAKENPKLVKMRYWPDPDANEPMTLVKLSYSYAIKDWTDEVCQSRGIIIDWPRRKIIARPFDKFFNLGEKLQLEDLPKNTSYTVLDKLDGVLIVPFKWKDKVHYTTRGSFNNEFTKLVEEDPAFSATRKRIEKLNFDKYTYMFELIHPKAKILANYGELKELVLIGIRHTESGLMLEPNECVTQSITFGLEHTKIYDDYAIDEVLEQQTNKPLWDEPENHEGFVIQFANGLLIKIKRHEYVALVKLVKKVSTGNLIQLMMDGKYQEYKEKLPEEVVAICQIMEDEIGKKWDEFWEKLQDVYADTVVGTKTRKDLALKLNTPEYKQWLPGVFKLYDKQSADHFLWMKLKRNKREYFPTLDNIVPGVDR